MRLGLFCSPGVGAGLGQRRRRQEDKDNDVALETLNELVGTAVVDRRFRRALLRDPRRVAIGFGLAPDEVEAVAQIRAANLDDFAQQLHHWVKHRNRRRVTVLTTAA